MTATPPEWAEALLRLVLDRDHADSVSGDLLEEYRATIHPARGQSRADRWYVMQTLGYVARSAGFWAAIFGGAFVARTSLDWLAPTDDFHVRSAVSTSVGVGTLMVAGLWAGWRSSTFAAGTVAGLATAGFGAVVSIVGAVALLAVAHDPGTMAAIRGSGGLSEVFTLPFMLLLPGAIVGTVGGVAGAAVRRVLSPGSPSPHNNSLKNCAAAQRHGPPRLHHVSRLAFLTTADGVLPLCFDKRFGYCAVEGTGENDGSSNTWRTSMGEERMDLPQGTLDLLILKTLALEPQHGWAVSERLQQVSGQALQVGQGSLYPSLHRLERSGRIKAVWRTTENNRRAKYYELTRAGRKQLEAATEDWRRLTAVVNQVLDLS